MSGRVRLPRGPVTDRHDPILPVSVATECRVAADLFIDRDAEHLAEASGISARTINRQRERHAGDRMLAAEIVAGLLLGARRLGWPFERRATYARPILEALGADAVPVGIIGSDMEGINASLARSMRETTEAFVHVVTRLRGGISESELDEIEAEIQQAIESFHRLRRECQVTAGGTNVRSIQTA